MPAPLDLAPPLDSAAGRLHQLRAASAELSRIGPNHSLPEAMQGIVESAARLAGSDPADQAAAVVYVYDPVQGGFDPQSRVSAGEQGPPVAGDAPRPEGMGAQAVRQRRRILSYEDTAVPMHDVKRDAGTRTLACYPLLVAGQPVGVLYFSLKVERRFTSDELLCLDIFVYQAAAAIHHTRRFEGVNRSLQRKVDELERLRRAEQAISSRLSLEDTLREILDAALNLTRAEHGSFRLLDKASGRLRLRAVAGDEAGQAAPGREESLEVSERGSVMGWVGLHRRAARIADLREPPWSEIYRPLHPDREMRSELAVPLLGAGGGLEGILNLESPAPGAFSDDDQRLLEGLATQAVIALQEATLLRAIEEVSSRLLSQPLPDLLALTVAQACELLNVPHGAVWTISPEHPDQLALQAATAGHEVGETLPLSDSLMGSAARLGQPLASLDVREDPRFLRRDVARQMGWASALIVPLLMPDGAVRGVLAVYSAEPRAYTDWDTRLLTLLANHTAVAVQDAEYHEQLNLARERQAVAETFAALGDVAANLIHRVNNLIGVIPARVQGITDKRPQALSDDYVAGALRDIEDSARAAMREARETMAYLRPLRLQSTSVAGAYNAALTRLNVPPQVRLTARDLDGLPPVLAGGEQLRLVLVNLVENAMDAMAGKPGHIEVRGQLVDDPFEPTRQWVAVTVADDGPGVPEAERERIFDAEYSTKRSPKKLGFGLWWARSLVQRFGGSLRLADTETGCAFVIRLPVLESEKAELGRWNRD